jgi:hypothetical protein
LQTTLQSLHEVHFIINNQEAHVGRSLSPRWCTFPV